MARGARSTVFALAALIAAGGADARDRSRPIGLEGTLHIDRWAHGLRDPVELTFTLSNRSVAPVAVPRWQTPFDGLDADLLEVTRDGEQVPYTGRLIKRAAPLPEDYLVLAPGASFSVTFDPTAAYDMTVRGHYSVRYRAALQSPYLDLEAATGRQLLLGPPRLPELASNSVQLWVEGVEPGSNNDVAVGGVDSTGVRRRFGEPGGGGSVTGSSDFTSCTTSQQATLTTARSNALRLAAKARIYLAHDAADSGGMYRTWFDASGAGYGWDGVEATFTTIESVFAAEAMTFDCSCKQRYYAYVYPDDPYTIYLCQVFWTAPELGTDSQAGTLVHETSHFTIVADTDDHVYGTAGAMNLARTDPAKAVTNADNHEYFAEHQP